MRLRRQVLTDDVVQDLNVNPTLPFEDNSFNIITNVVSVDYLTKPLNVFKEMRRILKPGGLAIMRTFLEPSNNSVVVAG
ncbi:uncharacterized protein [Cicer arietinum]|uniref:uncharacterized protein n=1 Tax=Cicer arietinum TaxID=3827 RepID=UPI003CC50C59